MRKSVFSSLSLQQKEAVGLLQIGTFLEYFDLMLYVHMAVLLNELFFPKTDPHTASLIAAFAFCSTYVLRPFGALLFGWIGDNIGRKSTVIITTMIMAFSCVVMANVPTYAQIGIAAAWIVTACRILQGLSSMGEIMGAIIYLTELIKPPFQYPVVSLVALSSSLGAMCALGVASLVTHFGFDWRIAFWVGAGIAVIGSVARTKLRESPEFLAIKLKKQQNIETYGKNSEQEKKEIKESKTPPKNILAYFFIECSYALMFYVVFIYFTPTLKSFGSSAGDIITHNFYLSMLAVVFNVAAVILVKYIHPLKIMLFRANMYLGIILIFPFAINYSSSVLSIFCLQTLFLLARGGATPADSIFVRGVNVRKRVSLITMNYALSRSVMHISSAFGLVYLTEWIGHYGIWIIAIPVSVGYVWSIRHFQKLEGLGANSDGSYELIGSTVEMKV